MKIQMNIFFFRFRLYIQSMDTIYKSKAKWTYRRDLFQCHCCQETIASSSIQFRAALTSFLLELVIKITTSPRIAEIMIEQWDSRSREGFRVLRDEFCVSTSRHLKNHSSVSKSSFGFLASFWTTMVSLMISRVSLMM